jgi:predicted RNA-binding Zn-ribbon protein involved in translation (DUF1610 family)
MDDTVWSQEFSWVCPVCGFKIPDGEMHITWRDDDREYDIAACPSCGTQSIVPREYW